MVEKIVEGKILKKRTKTAVPSAWFFGVILLILVATFPYAGYADVTTEEIVVKCNATSVGGPWLHFDGKPNTQYILTTIGMRVPDVDDFVTNWLEYELEVGEHIEYPHIVAKYISPDGNFEYWADMWPSGKKFICPKGYALAAYMFAPNDPNPCKYQYVATLTKITDD